MSVDQKKMSVDQKTIEVYDKCISEYEKLISKELKDANLDIFMEMIERDGKVLDLGCGTGTASLELLKNGFIPFPVDASTSNVPTIGPVHEKDTKAKVKAMKKIPIKPPFPSASTLLFVQEEGN